MADNTSYAAHTRAVIGLGLPLIGSQLAQITIQVTDTVMLGWYGIESLAAAVLAGSVYFTTFILGAGFAWAVMPVVAAASESGDETQIRRITRMGLWASLGYAAIFVPILVSSESLFLRLGQDPEIANLAASYLQVMGWGLVPALLFMVLRSYLSALERARFILWVAVVGAVLNGVLDYALIFGHFGFPEMGVRGAAVASVLALVLSLVLAAIYSVRSFPEHRLFARLWRPDLPALSQIVRLGLPIGFTSLAEVGLFSLSSMMMGWLGAEMLAAHGIALQLSAITFMLHIGLSQAATVRSGRAFGRGDPDHLAGGAKVAIAMSVVFAVLTAIAFVAIPVPLISLFLDPSEPAREMIIAFATSLLVAAAVFQIADAMQVMALGLLRGMQDTRVPMLMATISYWAIGAPLSYILAFEAGLGGVGIWCGLAAGLFCAAGSMMWRFWSRVLPRLVPAE